MSDQTPEQASPDAESKKDTVRINLPANLAGRPIPTTPDSTRMTAPISASAPIDEESKKETAVMGKPASAPKAKSDTSRVQVAAAKPAVPEMPRPTVKLRREEPPPTPSAMGGPAVAPIAASAPTMAMPTHAAPAAGPGIVDMILSIAAMAASIAVVVWLYQVSQIAPAQ